LSAAYGGQRAEVEQQAEAVAAEVRERLAEVKPPVLVGPSQVSMAVQTLLTIYDRANGGFGGAPKFPQAVYLEMLLAAREFAGEEGGRQAIDQALRLTLDKMALGGIFDQVGGGFHRYSTDAVWLTPHFEKMLYDQGQLVGVYGAAAAVYGDALYAETARRIAGVCAEGDDRGGRGVFHGAGCGGGRARGAELFVDG